MVHKELADKGIDIYFDHGVYANAKEGFIAINDNYVIPAVDSNMSQPPVAPGGMTDHNTLFNSPYQVMLFPRDIHDSPGSLIVYFPNKRTWVWSSFIPTLLGTIVFTGLILFCFSYTIWVIFRQKKISEMKTDFINNMTHEFKTPIATISLAADSIVSPMVIDSHEKIERFSGIIKQENKRMLSQVEKVLQMALIDKRDFMASASAGFVSIICRMSFSVNPASRSAGRNNSNNVVNFLKFPPSGLPGSYHPASWETNSL
jgi:two-component system phosphate regulon sensor histidine kinase PhoR